MREGVISARHCRALLSLPPCGGGWRLTQ
ncbi:MULTISPECIES: hypothetical protein [Bradyrhizobium]